MPKRRERKEFVVDSHALLTYLQAGPGWQEVGRLLRYWKWKRMRARLSWINWGEMYYIIARHFGKEKAMEAMDFVAAYPVALEAVDFPLVEAAAELKASYRFSYADAFCAATALRYSAILVTGDPEFLPLKDRIKIQWISPR